ncbi:YaaC family protein [Thalassobacillus hwangdonensis]|uniref:YaaC family protein n=1 Tax=Thalassobacillus hwangdonensis TaxID=546108 RepID=A0ABW3L2Q8_9BACI
MQKDARTFLTYLKSLPHARSFLQECYKKQGMEEAEATAYKNSERFCYFLEHGLHYIETGMSSPLSVKPVLFFYGLGHLLKASLLIKDPEYPPSSKVLAHGLSTRKRKKQNYSFLQDEVKVQPQGLFTYTGSHLFQLKSSFQKANMDQLLQLIPEMAPLYQWRGERKLLPVGKEGKTTILLDLAAWNAFHLSERKIKRRFAGFNVTTSEKKGDILHIELESPLPLHQSAPFYFSEEEKTFYMATSPDAEDHLEEVLIHYMVLYNLSMIARYEVEWWMDVQYMRDTEDYAFIIHFLDITAQKITTLIAYWLMNQSTLSH